MKKKPADTSQKTALLMAVAALLMALIVSAIVPYDRLTWLMEVMPALIALPVLAFTYKRFPLKNLLYLLIFIHALILTGGGTYTYAREPALVAKEIFVRGNYVSGKKMIAFLAICVAMAISAWYEVIEWWAALIMGQGADEFLGTQGDQWDTPSDMWLAFLGATVAVVLLARLHDRQLDSLKKTG